jgi:hypothetical protein
MKISTRIGALVLAVWGLAPTASADLVGWWQFNNANLGSDSSGNGNNLIANGDPVFDPSALGGVGAVFLDGQSDFTQGASFPTGIPTGSSDYTLTAWINTTVNGSLGIIGWGDFGPPNGTNALRTGVEGLDNYWFFNDVSDNLAPLTDGQWHFVAATYDGSVRTLYIDNGPPVVVPSSGLNSQPGNFAVGNACFWCNGGEFFNGELADVRVYNTALGASEIQGVQANVDVNIPEPSTLLLGLPALLFGIRKVRAGRRLSAR